MKQEALAATNRISQRTKLKHWNGMILGIGFGVPTKIFKISRTLVYSKLPNFCIATAESHKGKTRMGCYMHNKIIATDIIKEL